MPAGEKRTLTDEERIRFEEEERYLTASRGILEERLASVQEELESSRMQERQLKDQMDRIGSQLKSQKENRARQVALQLDLNKTLSKTRVSFMKVVTDAMASGNLAQSEGLAFMFDETVKEILTLDDLDRPHANHRCQGLRNTCLDILALFPPPNHEERVNETQDHDPFVSSCFLYLQNGRCDLEDCPHHESGEPRIPPQLDPLPAPLLPGMGDVDNGEVPQQPASITAWWMDPPSTLTFPIDSNPLPVETVLCSMGVRVTGEKLLLENASSEGASATVNIARYVDGFLLTLLAGLKPSSFDLNYLLKALEDLSFRPPVIETVKSAFSNISTLENNDSLSFACGPNFCLQLELLKATFILENESSLSNLKVDEASISDISRTWQARRDELSSIDSLYKRRLHTLTILFPVGLSILQLLSKTAEAIRRGEYHNLTTVHDQIDEALLALLRLTCEDAFLQGLLVPLFAGNIALACALKGYYKAHSRLESLLNYGQNETSVNLMVFSDLLWSQLVQLRMCLPPRDIESAELLSYKRHLDDSINDLGIRLRFVKPVVGRIK